ncbi:MAG: phage holin family protein [Acidimicrobiaceae bacterium]|nr:phage holin family protein [Acidimicrobiaceae bacterium]
MLARLVVRLVVLAAIIAGAARIVPGVHVHGGFFWYVWLALIYSVVNLILGPIFRLLALPLIAMTLGLFLLVINAAILEITAVISDRLTLDNFGSAVLGGLVIAVFGCVAEFLLPARMKNRRRRRRARRA